MYTILDETISQPTILNGMITSFYNAVVTPLVKYANNAIEDVVFGQDVQPTINQGNDFHYLLTLLVIIHYDEAVYYNANATNRTQAELYEEYSLEEKRLYFNKNHQFDIVPLYSIFNITDSTCSNDTILGPDTDVDLDCLIN